MWSGEHQAGDDGRNKCARRGRLGHGGRNRRREVTVSRNAHIAAGHGRHHVLGRLPGKARRLPVLREPECLGVVARGGGPQGATLSQCERQGRHSSTERSVLRQRRIRRMLEEDLRAIPEAAGPATLPNCRSTNQGSRTMGLPCRVACVLDLVLIGLAPLCRAVVLPGFGEASGR